MPIWLFDGVNQEKIHVALEMEVGTRVAVCSHLENHPANHEQLWGEMHIQELCKEGQRRVDFEQKVQAMIDFEAREKK